MYWYIHYIIIIWLKCIYIYIYIYIYIIPLLFGSNVLIYILYHYYLARMYWYLYIYILYHYYLAQMYWYIYIISLLLASNALIYILYHYYLTQMYWYRLVAIFRTNYIYFHPIHWSTITQGILTNWRYAQSEFKLKSNSARFWTPI